MSLHGTDYNPSLVGWCQNNLSFAEFRQNLLAPPLSYPDDSFDFVYAFSVFTHLSAQLQTTWVDELRRMVKPGGFLLFTVHSTRAREQLTPHERIAFDQEALVVRYETVAGSNLAAAFHPEEYLRTKMAVNRQLLDIRDSAIGRTFVLFRKPGGEN